VPGRIPWDGRTVVCIASGPSLTASDCALVRAAGHPVVVTNTTFRLCPWADVLFAFDSRWWKMYQAEVEATFAGRKIAVHPSAEKYGAESTVGEPWFGIYRNSGACAGSLAIASGAARVILLGYDCGFARDGRKHWHSDHPEPLENAATLPDWKRLFAILARRARQAGVPVLNASRHTTLECFKRVELESVL
jgi:hypothetical protein